MARYEKVTFTASNNYMTAPYENGVYTIELSAVGNYTFWNSNGAQVDGKSTVFSNAQLVTAQDPEEPEEPEVSEKTPEEIEAELIAEFYTAWEKTVGATTFTNWDSNLSSDWAKKAIAAGYTKITFTLSTGSYGAVKMSSGEYANGVQTLTLSEGGDYVIFYNANGEQCDGYGMTISNAQLIK